MRIAPVPLNILLQGMNDPASHIDWILMQGRLMDLQGLADGLGERMRENGVPLMRLRLGLRTTHPLTAALSVFWEADSAPLDQLATPHGLETSAEYVGSPMQQIAQSRRPFRRHLTDLNPRDHVTLHDLRSRGATDYYGLPMTFSQGNSGIVIFTSDGPGGFSDADIAGFDAITSVITPVVDTYSQHHLATAIATSYLGQRTGRRVLDGQITRGDIETVEAAILISDIRGWTRINATRPPAEALDLANRYFEVISDAVDCHQGEILKFLGDGVLALFPSDGSTEGRASACQNAVAAAKTAHRIAVQSELQATFGIGIHFGEVLYGNIGARARIDFTVLGQAVNIAARIEALTSTLGQSVLVSQAVADTGTLHTTHISTELLKGLTDPMPIFAPANN